MSAPATLKSVKNATSPTGDGETRRGTAVDGETRREQQCSESCCLSASLKPRSENYHYHSRECDRKIALKRVPQGKHGEGGRRKTERTRKEETRRNGCRHRQSASLATRGSTSTTQVHHEVRAFNKDEEGGKKGCEVARLGKVKTHKKSNINRGNAGEREERMGKEKGERKQWGEGGRERAERAHRAISATNAL